MGLVFLLYAFFASVFTIAKEGLEYTAPLFLVGSRMFVAGILLLFFQGCKDLRSLYIRKEDVKGIILLGLFNIYLTNIFEFWGLQYLSSFKTCFFYSLSPFLSAFFSYFLLKEGLSGKKWLGLIVGFFGFIPILLFQESAEEALGHLAIFSWAELSVILAVACSVMGWIFLRKLVMRSEMPPLIANGYSMVIGGGAALMHSLLVEQWDPIPTTNTLSFFKTFTLLIIISNFVCYNLYGYLLKKFSATFMTFAGFITPIFTALFGYIFLQEQVSWEFFLSLAIVLSGLTVFYYEELRRDKPASVVV